MTENSGAPEPTTKQLPKRMKCLMLSSALPSRSTWFANRVKKRPRRAICSNLIKLASTGSSILLKNYMSDYTGPQPKSNRQPNILQPSRHN